MTDDMAMGLAGFAVLFLMILLQVPVGVAMALVGVVGTGILIGFEPALALLAIEPSAALASESLAIIAMFLLMGNLAHAGGLSAELYRLADDALGHLKGGLIYATIGACAGFGAISGLISQPPFWRTPPQGPLRRVLGQFIGQAMPVSPRVHCPQDWESNKKPFTAPSKAAKGLSSRS